MDGRAGRRRCGGRDLSESGTRHAQQQAERSALCDTGRTSQSDLVNCPVSNSFCDRCAGAMADGSEKPIDQVPVGDRALAEDPSADAEPTEPVMA